MPNICHDLSGVYSQLKSRRVFFNDEYKSFVDGGRIDRDKKTQLFLLMSELQKLIVDARSFDAFRVVEFGGVKMRKRDAESMTAIRDACQAADDAFCALLKLKQTQWISPEELMAHARVSDLSVVQLDLKKMHLSEIPAGISGLRNLQSLNLNGNRIQKIEHLEQLTELKQLYLSENWIEQIAGLDTLVDLRNLNLSENNKIRRITGLEKLSELKELNLNRTGVSVIEGLESLEKLVALDLEAQKITAVSGLEKMRSLKRLSLANTQITSLSGLEFLTNLLDIDLMNVKATDYSLLKKLTNLKKINLSGSMFSDFSDIEGMTKIKELNVARCRLKTGKVADKRREYWRNKLKSKFIEK